jgi:hypothetical protein
MQLGDLVSVRRYKQIGIITWMAGEYLIVMGLDGKTMVCYDSEVTPYDSERRFGTA